MGLVYYFAILWTFWNLYKIKSTLFAYLFIGKLTFFFEKFTLIVFLARQSFLFRSFFQNWFNTINPTWHVHILIHYFEGFHDAKFAIFELFVSDCIGDIAKLWNRLMIMLEFFVSGEGRALSVERAERVGGGL